MTQCSRAGKGLNLFVEIEYEAVNEAATCCFESGFFSADVHSLLCMEDILVSVDVMESSL